uniref:Uncharacterized protein n=1 Tax=Arundo donax TaxID=35708 RepID=A0A0A9FLM0_ARUDO
MRNLGTNPQILTGPQFIHLIIICFHKLKGRSGAVVSQPTCA